MKFLLAICLVTSWVQAAAQPKPEVKEIRLTNIFDQIIGEQDKSESLVISNYRIKTDDLKDDKDLYQFLIEKYDGDERLVLDDARIMIDRPLEFVNCEFESSSMNLSMFRFQHLAFNNVITKESYMNFTECRFGGMKITESELHSFGLHRCRLDGKLEIYDSEADQVFFFNSEFMGKVKLISNRIGRFWLYESTLHPTIPGCSILHNTASYGRQNEINYQFKFQSDPNSVPGELQITRTQFLANDQDQLVYLSGDFSQLWLWENAFQGSLALYDAAARDHFVVYKTEILGRFSLYNFLFSEFDNQIFWKNLEGYKLCILDYPSYEEMEAALGSDSASTCSIDEAVPYTFFKGETPLEIESEIFFKGLIRTYRKLYQIFRDNGDLESANAAYVEMKEVESRKLKHIYETSERNSFKHFLRWKLNRLMKFYTEHGTEPAKAIYISLWVILVFGVFYFFFPSEWDINSKSKLVKDYRQFIEKNDHGYFKPFIAMMLGFAISLINALTLSVNSFVTLGFGTIPTRGLARYVCVAQGFIGWFLLSIFTVALINQVLA